MKTKFFLITLLLALFGVTLSTSANDLQICRFKDNKSGAVSLTFDDGTRDHLLKALPLLTQYGYRGTFYIIVKRVAKQVKDPASTVGQLTWDEIKVLLDAGHEIGNHSMTHYRLTTEKDQAKLLDEINGPLPIFKEKLGIVPETFCYPGNASSKEIEQEVLKNHLGAARWRFGCGGKNFTLEKWEAQLDKVIAHRQHHTMMFHSVMANQGYAAFANDGDFQQCLETLKKRDERLWVDTYAAVIRYQLLRDAASINILDRNDKTINAELLCQPAKPITGSLTLRYTGKKKITVKQGDATIPVNYTKAGAIFTITPGKFQVNIM